MATASELCFEECSGLGNALLRLMMDQLQLYLHQLHRLQYEHSSELLVLLPLLLPPLILALILLQFLRLVAMDRDHRVFLTDPPERPIGARQLLRIGAVVGFVADVPYSTRSIKIRIST